MNFDLSTAQRIVFGPDKVKEAPSIILTFGSRVLLVSGRSNLDTQAVMRKELTDRGAEVFHFGTSTEEPTIQAAEDGATIAKQTNCDLVIGFGGGSSLDLAKAIAALAANPGSALDYLEVVGKGQPLANPPLPVIAIPTSAGTGTEVTRNAVLTDPKTKIKASLRHSMMIPKVAIIDPALTVSMPKDVTAATGMDALTQLIEPYLSNSPNDFTDMLCVEGIKRVGRSLEVAWATPSNLAARADMSYAALLSGMALANAKLGAVHGFAGPVGAMFSAPHGVLCARFLAPVLEENFNESQEQNEPNSFQSLQQAECPTVVTPPQHQAYVRQPHLVG